MEQRLSSIKENVPKFLDVDWDGVICDHRCMKARPYPVDYPRVYQLETTNKCNLNCVFCPRQNMVRPLTTMSDRLFRVIVDRDLRWTKSVELFGFGEPLCDAQLPERVALLKKRGIYVVVATNCLLADTMPDSLFTDIDYMVLDVDAVDKEHYEAVRIGGEYEVMIENVERILEIRRSSGMYTAVQFIDYESSAEKKKEFMKKYEKKADEVRVKFLDTFAGQAFEGKTQSGVSCLEPLYGVSIWSNGDVVMCDRDINSVNVLGNVRRSSLLAIWNNEVVRRTQEAHMGRKGEGLKPCDRCEEWRLTNLRNVPELTVNMFKGGFV